MRTKVILKLGINENNKVYLDMYGLQAVLPDNDKDINEGVIFMQNKDKFVCFTTFNDIDPITHIVAMSKMIRDIDVERYMETNNFHLGSLDDMPLEMVPKSWKSEIEKNCKLYGKDTRVLTRIYKYENGKLMPTYKNENFTDNKLPQ